MDYRDLIILLVFLTIGVFMVFVGFVVYFVCRKYRRDMELREETENLLTNNSRYSIYETQESSFIEINLVDLQKQEQQKSRVETQQSAFLYLQFFIRSNTSLDCKYRILLLRILLLQHYSAEGLFIINTYKII